MTAIIVESRKNQQPIRQCKNMLKYHLKYHFSMGMTFSQHFNPQKIRPLKGKKKELIYDNFGSEIFENAHLFMSQVFLWEVTFSTGSLYQYVYSRQTEYFIHLQYSHRVYVSVMFMHKTSLM